MKNIGRHELVATFLREKCSAKYTSAKLIPTSEYINCTICHGIPVKEVTEELFLIIKIKN